MAARRPRARLRLEGLESRYCPSTLTEATAAPTITLSVNYESHRQVTLYGQVTDANPDGLVVTFTGVVADSTTTYSDGSFAFSAVPTELGDVHATTVNELGVSSNTATVTLTNTAPVITDFNITCSGTTCWATGSVSDEAPDWLEVALGGLPSLEGQYACVREDGSFSFEFTRTDTDSGVATAQVTDWWGVESEIAQELV